MVEIGTGIALASAILAATYIVSSLLAAKKKNNPGGNPNSKYLTEKAFNEYKEGIRPQLEALTTAVSEMKDSIQRVHTRIDKYIEK